MRTQAHFTAGVGPAEGCLSENGLKRGSRDGFFEEVLSSRTKIWFKNTCSLKKGGFSFLFRSAAQMRRTVFIFPGQVVWVKCDVTNADQLVVVALKEKDKSIPLNTNLTALINKKDVTLDYPSGTGARKTIFQFSTDAAALDFYQTVLTEKSRSYIGLPRHAPKLESVLNMAVRSLIDNGDSTLEKLYFSLLNQTSMNGAIESLFTNYASFIGVEDPSPAAFARLLSLAASDPAFYILFMCFTFESGQGMVDEFHTTSAVHLFDALLTYVHSIVSKSEWATKRILLCKLFQYPATAISRTQASPPSAGMMWWYLPTVYAAKKFLQFNCHVHRANITSGICVDWKFYWKLREIKCSI